MKSKEYIIPIAWFCFHCLNISFLDIQSKPDGSSVESREMILRKLRL